MRGERADDLGGGPPRRGEGQRAVGLADDAADDDLGQRDRRGEQRAHERVALDDPKPARHVQTGGRDRDDAVSGRPSSSAARRATRRRASCHTGSPRRHLLRRRVLDRGAGEGAVLLEDGPSAARRIGRAEARQVDGHARRSRRASRSSTRRHVSAESAKPCSSTNGGPSPSSSSARVATPPSASGVRRAARASAAVHHGLGLGAPPWATKSRPWTKTAAATAPASATIAAMMRISFSAPVHPVTNGSCSGPSTRGLPCARTSAGGSLAPGGRCTPASRSASVMFEATRAWKIAPRPAIPVAIPTWRKVLLMPEAIPARRWSTTPTAVEAIAGLVRPTPKPASRKPGSSAVQPESASTPRISSRPSRRGRARAANRNRAGTRSVRLPENAAAKNDNRVSGRKRRPACSGA